MFYQTTFIGLRERGSEGIAYAFLNRSIGVLY